MYREVRPGKSGALNGTSHTTVCPASSGTGFRAYSAPVEYRASNEFDACHGWTTVRRKWRHRKQIKGGFFDKKHLSGVNQYSIDKCTIKTSNRFLCLNDRPKCETDQYVSHYKVTSFMDDRESENMIQFCRSGVIDIDPCDTIELPEFVEPLSSISDLASTQCDIVEFHEENEMSDVEIEDNSEKNRHNLAIGLWNVNSINQQKFDYCTEYLGIAKNSILCLTELSSENRDTIHILAKNSEFPILTHPENKRVGIMIPSFLKDRVEIIDFWSWSQSRRRNSNRAVQLTAFKVNLSSIIITIVIVYAAPDTNIDGKRALCRKLCDLEKENPNVITVGDFNIDVKDTDKNRFLKTELGDAYTQIVKDFTRVCTRSVNGSIRVSKTCIDLVFLTRELKRKLINTPTIRKDAPSDHFLVEFSLDVRVPSKYVIKEYYLDTTRRKPIPKSKLDEANSEMSRLIKSHETDFLNSNQVESFTLLMELMVTVLDIYAPMNKSGKLTKRIYRFTMPHELRKLQKCLRHAKNKWREVKRKKGTHVKSSHEKYRKLRNKFNKAVKSCRNQQKSAKLYDGIMTHNNIWSIIKKFLPDPDYQPPSKKMEIKGKSGIELANHMAQFFYDRAHLVSDEEALACVSHVPEPAASPLAIIDIDDTEKYTVKELFQDKSKPSLAAGPDTVSHRHIIDLMPSIETSLQASIDKPLVKFTDIRKSYTRLLEKEKTTRNSVLTEKSQRPISELNVLPKYGSIKIFIDQLRQELLKLLKDNQYAFPGKGGPMAIVETLDNASELSAKGLKTVILLWDFSNAFCTTIHNIIVQIAQKYNLSERIVALLKQFLEQSFAAIKFSDSEGFYVSDEIDTGRGTPQGQIGSDLIFALVNDCIDPITILDEIIIRTKYVDDFTDVLAAKSVSVLFDSYEQNEIHLKNSATSVGLKLNEGKTKIVPLNIHRDDLLDRYQERYVYQETLLGFKFSVEGSPCEPEEINPTSKNKFHMSLRPKMGPARYTRVSGDPAARELIARLNSATRTIYTLRKFEKNTLRNLKAATALVWSCCYDLGCVRSYCSDSIWDDVCKSIRKVIKAAGLDHMTRSEIVYRISTGYSPDIMALKQIVQLGIKFLDDDNIVDSFKVKTLESDKARPFWHRFVTEFNALPHILRKFVVDTLDPTNKNAMAKIKHRLKSHYIKLYNPNGKLSKEKISKLVDKNLYSTEKIEKRKRDYEEIRQHRIEASQLRAQKEVDKLFVTPSKRRKKFSDNFVTPKVVRQVARCYCPHRNDVNTDTISDFEIIDDTPRKRHRSPDGLHLPSKRTRVQRGTVDDGPTIETMRREESVLVSRDCMILPTLDPNVRYIRKNDDIADVTFIAKFSGYSKIPDKISGTFKCHPSKNVKPRKGSIADSNGTVHSGREGDNQPTRISVEQLRTIKRITPYGLSQYKQGQRTKKRLRLKELYRLNRLRPPEKSNTLTFV